MYYLYLLPPVLQMDHFLVRERHLLLLLLLSSFFFFFFFCVTKKKTLRRRIVKLMNAFVCFFIQFFSLLYRALFSLSHHSRFRVRVFFRNEFICEFVSRPEIIFSLVVCSRSLLCCVCDASFFGVFRASSVLFFQNQRDERKERKKVAKFLSFFSLFFSTREKQTAFFF